jgi:hypothetical protein
MKKYLYLLILGLNACKLVEPDFKSTNFYLENKCNAEILVTTGVIKPSQINGPQKITLTDNIKISEKFLLRKLNVSADIKIKAVFNSLTISKNNVQSKVNFLDDMNWKKTSETEFVLVIEDNFFN